MKITITGSLGNISKPLTEKLIKAGHAVTVISSKPEKQKDIEALGATAAIGSLQDADFLTTAFTGADAVYTMVPPNNFFDPNLDLLPYYQQLGRNYAEAIKKTGVKTVVNLSTFGADLDKGNGILIGAHHVEKLLNEVESAGVKITHIRPTSFYYNLLGYVEMIKHQDVIAANYGADDIIPWVSPVDIAAAVAEELENPNADTKVRYVASQELSGNETARILGEAIGKPNLKWILTTDEQTLEVLKSIGMNPNIAAGLVEMYAALHNGSLAADYNRNKPTVMGNVKLTDYAKEFAAVYQK